MMNDNLLFCNHLLKLTKEEAAERGIDLPKLTVYKYNGFSRGDYHTYQVYAGNKVLGDYGGHYASEAKVTAINEHFLAA